MGAGETSREELYFPRSLYERIIDELGGYLLEVELCNWGEPLLNKDVCEFIRAASERGINTTVCTNFSLPFDKARAEELVSSGVGALGVSIDGTRQESYEQYRVGGDLETVLRNVELVQEAKRRLSSPSPRIVWSFHVFEHNKDDIQAAQAMARDLEVDIGISKGWVAGDEWGSESDVDFPLPIGPECCWFLWERATIHANGGVSPCDGTFYKEDDYGSMNGTSFKQVWNNRRFQQARRANRARKNDAEVRDLVCFDCPATVTREDYFKHLAAGGSRESFKPRFNTNDGFNHFFGRRPSPSRSES